LRGCGWGALLLTGASAVFAQDAPRSQAASQPPQPATPQPDTPPRVKPAPLPPDLVKAFVVSAHRDLDGTRQLLEEHPTLLNATWDWGGGDFESAIGGAGHMGRRDIAELLLSRGVRMDIFVATMLGRLDVVKATLTAYPGVIEGRGPHGLTFLHHAGQGGEPAREVLDYLQGVGAR
jgi:hypothetical protein